MDHLVLPIRPTRSLPLVRIFTAVEYDDGPFEDYLERIGWSEEELVNWFSPRTSQELHVVLQTWTYFGLLSTILDAPVSIRQFTKRENGEDFLCTKELPNLMHLWVHRVAQMTKVERLAQETLMHTCLEKVWRIYDALGMGRSSHNEIDSFFCLSVQVLCEYLIAMQKYAFQPPHVEARGWRDHKVLIRTIAYATNRLFSDMHDAGWCKAETYHMWKLSPSEQCLAYCLDRPGPGKDHSRCSDTKCFAYQIGESDYKTRHVEEDCHCEFAHCSQSQLAKILLDTSGSIPLISDAEPVRGQDGKLWITLIPSKSTESGRGKKIATKHTKFVSISHVWSDGLGNNTENAIPLCQLRRLSGLVSGLYPSASDSHVPFWFDTLCFPLDPPEAGDLALVRMRESYEDSDQVLVLDGYLLSAANSAEMSDNELLLRIFCAPWSRRLWTLQEGVLPSRLIFRIGDRYVPSRYFMEKLALLVEPWMQGRPVTKKELSREPVPNRSWLTLMEIRKSEAAELGVQFSPVVIEEFLRSFPHHVARIISLDLSHYYTLATLFIRLLIAIFNYFMTSQRTTIPNPMDLEGVKMALANRTTSMARDEALCLGNLLGVNAADVVAARTVEDRMAIIWNSVFLRGKGHGALIFSAAAKLRTPGYRWAPKTLMDGNQMEFRGGVPSFMETAVKLPEGLVVSLPAVLVMAWKLRVGVDFSFRTRRSNSYDVSWKGQRASGVEADDCLVSSTGAFAILTLAALEHNGKPSFHEGIQDCWLGDVMGIVHQETEATCIRILASVDIKRLSDNSVSIRTPAEVNKGAEFGDSVNPLVGQVINRRKFLVD